MLFNMLLHKIEVKERSLTESTHVPDQNISTNSEHNTYITAIKVWSWYFFLSMLFFLYPGQKFGKMNLAYGKEIPTKI